MLTTDFVIYSFDHLDLIIDYIHTKKVPLLNDHPYTNQILWEFGHVLWFIQKHYIEELNLENTGLENFNHKYDSLICDRKYRFDELISFAELMMYKENIRRIVLSTHTKNDYVTWVNVLHMHMHLESFYFNLRLLGYDLLQKPTIKTPIDDSLEFYDVRSGTFLQGCNALTQFSWDNEKPHFNAHVDEFQIAKTAISVFQYKQFVNSDAYTNKNYWCHYGWKFIQENEITSPMHWESQLKFPMRPVCHVSLYEARAFAKWLSEKHNANYAIPTETEWEYMAKVLKPCSETLNYHPMENTNVGNQIYGNVWEWCDTRIYPYNGFRIDPLYKEFSYPFFGFKYIIKGGAWCCPESLITSYYRNAQLPTNRVQFIGIRLKKTFKI